MLTKVAEVARIYAWLKSLAFCKPKTYNFSVHKKMKFLGKANSVVHRAFSSNLLSLKLLEVGTQWQSITSRRWPPKKRADGERLPPWKSNTFSNVFQSLYREETQLS